MTERSDEIMALAAIEKAIEGGKVLIAFTETREALRFMDYCRAVIKSFDLAYSTEAFVINLKDRGSIRFDSGSGTLEGHYGFTAIFLCPELEAVKQRLEDLVARGLVEGQDT